MKFQVTPWLKQDGIHRSHFWRRAIYWVARPVISWHTRKRLSPATLAAWKPDFVMPCRGFYTETRRKWAARGVNLREAVILVQGTGTGWDVLSWARLRPKKIIATDLFSFEESWKEIELYCRAQFGVEVKFYQSPLETMPFLDDNSVDLCVSDAVFEHLKNLSSVLKESFRLLKPEGVLYASYGPMWFAPGGDHFSGRGGLKHVFNHLLLSPDEYQRYFKDYLQQEEDFQSGGRYVELDLFSKLSTMQYLDLYRQTGFIVDKLVVQVDPRALKFKKQYPQEFEQLKAAYDGRCCEDDFLTHSHLIRLKKSKVVENKK